FRTATPTIPWWRSAADFDETRYTLVFSDDGNFSILASVLHVLSIGLDGDVRQAPAIASLPHLVLSPLSIAYAGGRHLVVFGDVESFLNLSPQPDLIDRTRLQALRLDGALHPLDAAPFVVDDTPWANV